MLPLLIALVSFTIGSQGEESVIWSIVTVLPNDAERWCEQLGDLFYAVHLAGIESPGSAGFRTGLILKWRVIKDLLRINWDKAGMNWR